MVMLQVAALASAIVTAQNGTARTGANTREFQLSAATVNARRFGKVASISVDGDVYAQPLFVRAAVVRGRRHNVLIVATEHDSVYAFDVDRGYRLLWHATFVDAAHGVETVPSRDVQCPFIRPEVGITPTPVIDTRTGTIYVIARTREGSGGAVRYVQRLHALSMGDGSEKYGGPITIAAPGFDPLRENPRAALLLTRGTIYAAWASSCDVPPYHGWIFAYDARTLQRVDALNTSPNGSDAGIWQGDAGLAADEGGTVYAATGNGTFDANRGGHDYGDSVLAVRTDAKRLAVTSYFSPPDQATLSANDLDLGSGGPILAPANGHEKIVLTTKGGSIFLLDSRDLSRGAQRIYAVSNGFSGYGAAAYWNGNVYVQLSDDVLKRFAFVHDSLDPVPAASSAVKIGDPGATPAISANGTHNGIVWIIQSKSWRADDRPAVLRAYDAVTLRELYDSEQNPARDRAGLCVRFAIPTVADGRVYVGAKSEVDVYGAL